MMTPLNEDTLVQATTADYLEVQLGWESVFAYNNEAFGKEGELERESVCAKFAHTANDNKRSGSFLCYLRINQYLLAKSVEHFILLKSDSTHGTT